MSTKTEEIEFKVRVVTEPDGPSFHSYCPALKGLHTSGDTEEEALENAKDAIIAYLESLIKHGDPIPIGVGIEKTKTKKFLFRNHSKRHTEDLVLAIP